MVELIWHLLYRFLFVDFWVPVWPNLAASALVAIHVTKSNKKHGVSLYVGDQPGNDDEGSAR